MNSDSLHPPNPLKLLYSSKDAFCPSSVNYYDILRPVANLHYPLDILMPTDKEVFLFECLLN